MKNNWKDNSIQFPRLISELQAAGAFTNDVVECLRDSMDLSTKEIFEIVERADEAWEKIKLST